MFSDTVKLCDGFLAFGKALSVDDPSDFDYTVFVKDNQQLSGYAEVRNVR